MIVDTHIDVPYRLQEGWVDVTRGTDEGDFDYDRARLGGLNLPFMSIYTPAELEAEGGSFELANQLIDNVEALVGRAPEKFVLVTSTGEAEQARKQGLIGLAMGMENGSPIEGDLENLQFFFDRGIRYITLAHSLGNHISDSSFDEERQWSGLSPFGREVVREMNRQGIMVDISHVSDEAFYQVLEITKAPVIASQGRWPKTAASSRSILVRLS
jgi:membrane dipeptidase